MSESVRNYCEQVLGATMHAGSDEARADCLFCGKEKHMYVNVNSGLAHCFSCQEGKNLAQIICEVEGIDEDFAYVKAEFLLRGGKFEEPRDSRALAAAYMKLVGSARGQDGESPLMLPQNCVPIGHVTAARGRTYLLKRGYTTVHWTPYDLLYCAIPIEEEKRFRQHIVFPHYEDGALRFYTSRASYEPRRGIPKSYHPRGVSRGSVLFGYEAVVQSVRAKKVPLVIVEGPLDMLSLAGYAIALLGKSMSEEQAQRIARLHDEVVVALDLGEHEAQANVADALKSAGVRSVKITKHYGPNRKDPGDLVDVGIVNAVRFVIKNASSIGALHSLGVRLRTS